MSYAQFGRWYNQGGFDKLPWLELLDLRKWPRCVSLFLCVCVCQMLTGMLCLGDVQCVKKPEVCTSPEGEGGRTVVRHRLPHSPFACHCV